MSIKKNFLPFALSFDGLFKTGDARKEAELVYKFDGYELDAERIKLRKMDFNARQIALTGLDHRYGRISGYEHDRTVARLNGVETNTPEWYAIKLKHNRITQYDHDLAVLGFTYTEDTIAYKQGKLDIDLLSGKISQLAHDKESATLREEPWIDIIDHGFDLSQGLNGVHFEFDWNSLWIDYLRLNNYSGDSEQDIVEKWFADVCREQIGNDHLVVDPDMAMLIPMDRYKDRMNRPRP